MAMGGSIAYWSIFKDGSDDCIRLMLSRIVAERLRELLITILKQKYLEGGLSGADAPTIMHLQFRTMMSSGEPGCIQTKPHISQ